MKVGLMEVDGKAYVSIEMENTIDRFNLMKEMTEYGNTIQRMYWRSKFDYNHIEYFEPKIYDAFIFCIDFTGTRFTLEKVLKEYKPNKQIIEFDKLYSKLNELEIQKYATAMINSL